MLPNRLLLVFFSGETIVAAGLFSSEVVTVVGAT